MAKITFIGAGSMVFAKNLVGDILTFEALSDSTISLMDNIQRLAVKGAFEGGREAVHQASNSIRSPRPNCRSMRFTR